MGKANIAEFNCSSDANLRKTFLGYRFMEVMKLKTNPVSNNKLKFNE